MACAFLILLINIFVTFQLHAVPEFRHISSPSVSTLPSKSTVYDYCDTSYAGPKSSGVQNRFSQHEQFYQKLDQEIAERLRNMQQIPLVQAIVRIELLKLHKDLSCEVEYVQRIKYELAQAQKILSARADYKSYLQEKQVIHPAYIFAKDSIIQEIRDFLDLAHYVDPAFFKRYVSADPRTHFHLFVMEIQGALDALQKRGLYTAETAAFFLKEFIEGVARHIAYIANHPVRYAQEVVRAQVDLF